MLNFKDVFDNTPDVLILKQECLFMVYVGWGGESMLKI